ncbi:serine hydrolase domain-containing protein [Lacinutrix jangbogonensis]|uniref:serine hydrolase domain-containing protein n=1 Tax=Lacinutrix jangbogonensis TaxID=1469557 RepID=UPI00068F07CB|nr:serine hydrolase domain-containing protein [Lacinutrix jangbogonensis]
MTKILSRLLVLVLTLSVLNCKPSTDKNETTSKVDKINELVSLYSEYDMFHGTILVADQGEIIYKKGFGFANMEWDIPNKVDTKFQIASMTKSFTAMLIMQLVVEHKLDVHEPISTYLKDYPKTNGDQITIHHLLTHSAGIGRDRSNKEKHNQPEAMVNQFASIPLRFTPGERFKYSNSGYTLLGYIIETITAQSYEDVLQERIFKPLEMKNSGFHKHRKLIKNMAYGYNKNFGEYYDNDSTDETTAYAAGAIYSTVEDLFIWDQALNTELLLPKKYMDLIFVKHIIDSDIHYGYGWELITKPIGNTAEEVETVGHSGSIGGFRSLYTKIPSRNASVIILNNSSRSFRTSITTAITGILYNQPYDLPSIPLAQFMLKTIENEGIDKGIQFYKNHKDAPEYHVSEQELVVAGYRFLHAENPKAAAKIFKLATEVFPDHDNPFDSYAEALMALGKNDEAISNYKKSLTLNPKNNNAIKMLAKLGVTYSTDLLKTNNWGKELFAIPLHFAPDIELKGFEAARFPKGWNDTKSPNFWTYAFAWKVNIDKPLTQTQVEDYLIQYYNGLLSGVNKEKDLVLPKTTVEITQNKEGAFVGETTIYDTFVTRKPLVLHFNIKQTLCDKNGESILLFRVSPKKFNHKVWRDLMDISVLENSCD